MAGVSLFKFQYIKQCAQEGKDPLEEARRELADIDVKLAAADDLKLRRRKLIEVLDHLGDDSYRKGRSSYTSPSDDVSEDEVCLDEYKKAIVEALNANECKAMTLRELISATRMYDKDALIIRAVKELGDEEILSRDSENKVYPGPNW